jgi:2'-hydroxyisoflavone reductase
MNLLILGGGGFLGGAVLDAALAAGHRLTVFNRGLSRSAWPAGVAVINGDRTALVGRRWHAVVDTCGYVPAEVQASAETLRPACDLYLFVSSVSAYADTAAPLTAENHPLASAAGIARDDRDRRHYGPQKAACEAEVVRAFAARALVVRPGLIVGPGDRTGRFSYWPWRAASGGTMLVPDVPADRALQFIDVRDLAAWMLRLLELGAGGVFNASGPVGGPLVGWHSLVETCLSEGAAGGLGGRRDIATPCRVDEAFLLAHGVQPWSELPLWLPSIDPAYAGFNRDLRRAAAAGLTTRPLRETVRDVLAEGLPPEADPRRTGKLTRAREAELLAAWHAQAHAPDHTHEQAPRSPAPP